jgi:hypothetical protein
MDYSEQWLYYRLDDSGFGVRFSSGAELFLFSGVSPLILEPTEPPIQYILEAISLEIRLAEREADLSRSSSGKVQNTWSYASPLGEDE